MAYVIGKLLPALGYVFQAPKENGKRQLKIR